MGDPVVTCYGLTEGSNGGSQASIVVRGTVASQTRVIMIVSYLGETAPGGVTEGPIGSNPGTPLPVMYTANPHGDLFPYPTGWHGDPITAAYSAGAQSDGTPMPGLTLGGWTTGAELAADLYPQGEAPSSSPSPTVLHLTGNIVCPGAAP